MTPYLQDPDCTLYHGDVLAEDLIYVTYSRGFSDGQSARLRLTDTQQPVIPAYLEARDAVRGYRGLSVMSDALTRATRRARAYDLGYLRGFRHFV